MTIINSFLQRKKMRENSHGVFMVFAAYTLSFLLLLVGSDALYNIRSKADGLNVDSNEVNQITKMEEDEAIINPYGLEDAKEENYQVEYRYEYMQKHLQGYKQKEQEENQVSNQEVEEISDDTNWLLGYAMSNEEYQYLMGQIKNAEVFQEDVQAKAIASFSADSMEKVPTSSLAFTEDDVAMLERIVEAEATGEDIVGKILVANVVLNRMADDDFPDTVKDVIFQKVGGEYQFSPISDKRYWKVKITEETKEAVQRAINGEDHSKGALYFMARKIARKSSAKWFDENLTWLFKHGAHEFYK